MDDIADAIGEIAAGALARHFGGTALYVPRSIGEHHPIRVAIGREPADRLAAWAGGGTIAIPKQPERRARVIALRRAGALTIPQIARETGFSERHVYQLLRDDDAKRQPGLFDDL